MISPWYPHSYIIIIRYNYPNSTIEMYPEYIIHIILYIYHIISYYIISYCIILYYIYHIIYIWTIIIIAVIDDVPMISQQISPWNNHMITGSNPSPLPVPQDKSCDVQPQKNDGNPWASPWKWSRNGRCSSGWWLVSTPLKNMKNMKVSSQYMEKIKNVPNH